MAPGRAVDERALDSRLCGGYAPWWVVIVIGLGIRLHTQETQATAAPKVLSSHMFLPHLALCSVLQSFTVNVPVLDIKYVPHWLT